MKNEKVLFKSHARLCKPQQKRNAHISTHTPVRKAVIWKKKCIFNFFPENIFIITMGRLFNFSHYIVSFCWYILYHFQYYSIMLEIGKINK